MLESNHARTTEEVTFVHQEVNHLVLSHLPERLRMASSTTAGGVHPVVVAATQHS